MTPLQKLALRQTLSIAWSGFLVGLMHPWHRVAAVLLFAKLLHVWYLNCKVNKPFYPRNFVLISGSILTGILGVFVELWGITNGHWTYHDLPEGVNFPLWLPFAWALAFVFLYHLDAAFADGLGLRSFWSKLLLSCGIAAYFPTVGEMVAINMNVWTYSWPYQFLGMPILAVILLTTLHAGVYILITVLCRLFDVRDPVFGPK